MRSFNASLRAHSLQRRIPATLHDKKAKMKNGGYNESSF